MKCFLDSGSGVTLIPIELAPDKNQLLRVNWNLNAANGTKIEVLGQITLPMNIDGQVMQLTGLVSGHVSEVLLGADWLQQQGAVWDFTRGSMVLNGRQHRLHGRDPSQWCRRVI